VGRQDRVLVSRLRLQRRTSTNHLRTSFAGFGAVAVVSAWFLLPEVACRTPAEIDELFEKKVNLRHFKGYVTDVQMNATEQHFEEETKSSGA